MPSNETDLYEIILLIAFLVIFIAIVTFIIAKSISTYKKSSISKKKKEVFEAEVVGKSAKMARKLKESYVEKLKQNEQSSNSQELESDKDDSVNNDAEDDNQLPVEDKFETSIVGYKMVFKFIQTGEIKSYNVDKESYDVLNIGDKGNLTVKGIKYIGFELKPEQKESEK